MYSTRFEVGGTMFSGEVKIMVTDRGYLFHDITKIKRLPVNGGLTETSSVAASGNPSTDSITDTGTPVNSNSMQQGVKYSLPEVNVEKLTESQYNNFGWVRANDVLSAAEYNSLMSNYTGHKHKDDYFPVTRFGETVLHSSQHNDVLMYAKGSIKSPQITKVVRILADDANIKEVILRYERENNYRTFQIVRNYFGEWILNIDYRKDYDNYREYRAEQKRKNGQSSDTSGRTEQNRGRGFAEDSSAGRGNVKYSLSSADHATLLDRYENGEITRAEYLEAIKPKKGVNPVEIVNLTEEDADTTPTLPQPKGKGGQSGDGSLIGFIIIGKQSGDGSLIGFIIIVCCSKKITTMNASSLSF